MANKPTSAPAQRIIGVIMTYNCAGLVARAFRNIPRECFDEIICVDDGSTDDTVAVASRLGISVFTHPHTGYGGNLFFGFRKALEMGATHIIELHGDGQYDFAAVPETLERLAGGCDLILGNRYHKMLQPLRDGMDLARYLGNIFLSTIGRAGLGIPTRDLFPGFRAYSRRFVETIAIENTSTNYFFSFEIIAQARYCGLRICQVPVRCDYKGEHSSMKLSKGFPAILHTCGTVILYRLARLNIKRGIFASLQPLPEASRRRGGAH
jgi:glycosyltransferase involved in cell wall biosynthesis